MKSQEFVKISIAFEWWCAHGAFVSPTHCDDLRSFRRDLDEALNRNAFTSEQLPKVIAFMKHIDQQITTLDGADDCTFVCKRCGDRVSKRQKLGSFSPPMSPLTLSPANSPPHGSGARHPSLQPAVKLPPFLHSHAWGCQYNFIEPPSNGHRHSSSSPSSTSSSPRSSNSSFSSPRPSPLRLDIIAACNPSSKPKRYHLQLKKQEFRIQRLSERIKRRTSSSAPASTTSTPLVSGMPGVVGSFNGIGGGDQLNTSQPASVPMTIPIATSTLPPRHSSRRASKSDILQSPVARKVARPHRFTSTSATSVISRSSMSDRDEEFALLSQQQQQLQQQQQSSLDTRMFEPLASEQESAAPFLLNPSNDFNLSSTMSGFLSPTSQPFFIQLESPVVPPEGPVSSAAVIPRNEDMPARERFVVTSHEDLAGDTPLPTAIVAVPVPMPLSAPAWHQQLYNPDPHEPFPHSHNNAVADASNTFLPPLPHALPMYGQQRSGYEMVGGGEEPSSEFAALHIVENDFQSTPIPGPSSLQLANAVGLLGTDKCLNCSHGHPAHAHHRRRSSASSTGSAPAGYASLPMSASDALYLHKQQQYLQQQQQFQQLSAASHLDRHPDIYAASQAPSYVHTGPGTRKGDDSCVIS